MLQAQNARTPFLTKKRSFDLAWGAWAGILAVMTAVGAALTGSQMLMMYPKSAAMVEVTYPSLSQHDSGRTTELRKDSLAIFWGSKGIVFGELSQLTAPQRAGRVVVVNGSQTEIDALAAELERWVRANVKNPISVVAIGESLRTEKRIDFSHVAELASAIEKLNFRIFSAALRPAIVPLELVNPI